VTSLLSTFRRLVLREHEREHAEIEEHIAAADAQLNEMEVRLRRLEIEKRLRGRRLSGDP
jgi:predicted metal-dependent hydrolase